MLQKFDRGKFHESIPLWVCLVAYTADTWAEMWEIIAKWVGSGGNRYWWFHLVDRHCACSHCEQRRERGMQGPIQSKWRW